MLESWSEHFASTPSVQKTERWQQTIVLVEVHPNQDQAWSDVEQLLNLAEFGAIRATLDPDLALHSPAIHAPAGALLTEAIVG